FLVRRSAAGAKAEAERKEKTMKTVLCFVGMLATAVLATGQSVSAPKSNWLADSVTRDGGVVRMDGHVRIAACAVITADHAVGGVDNDTQLTGNVHERVTNGVDRRRVKQSAHTLR